MQLDALIGLQALSKKLGKRFQICPHCGKSSPVSDNGTQCNACGKAIPDALVTAGGLGSGRKPTAQDFANKAREFGYRHSDTKQTTHGNPLHTFKHPSGAEIKFNGNPSGWTHSSGKQGGSIGDLHTHLSELHGKNN